MGKGAIVTTLLDTVSDATQPLCALLMAGGTGLRLWPLSRPQRTKPLLKRFGSERSLVAETAARLSFLPPSRQFVNVTRGLQACIAQELPALPKDHIIVAPSDRDTLPSLLFATAHIARSHPNATLIMLASDNAIGDEAAFHDTLHRAVQAARSGPHLVSIGIKPTEASTRFGYMQLGDVFPGLADTWFGAGYVEKPKQEEATRLFHGNGHDWNSGIFVWTMASFRQALASYAKDESKLFEALCDARTDASRIELFGRLRSIAVDHGLLEHVPADGGTVRHVFVRGSFAWDDLGTLEAFTKELPADADGNAMTPLATAKGCRGSLLVTEGTYRIEAENLVDTCVVVSDIGDTLVASKHQLDKLRSMLVAPIEIPTSVIDGGVRLDFTGLVRMLEVEACEVTANGPSVVGLLCVQHARVNVDAKHRVVRVEAVSPVDAPSLAEEEPTAPEEPAANVGPRMWVATDEMEFGRIGALWIVEALRAALDAQEGELLVTMSAGETPVSVYRALVQEHKGALAWNRVRFVQMDEWLDVSPTDRRSFAFELQRTLTEPLGMAATFLDGRQGADAVLTIENDVIARGGFALAVHGIGVNGHLGFNEPPADRTSEARQVALDFSTRLAAQRRFGARPPLDAVTLGLRTLASAKKTIVLARGAAKSAAIIDMLAPASPLCPASMLTRDAQLDVLLDREAFAGLFGTDVAE
jgi:mannose-1-phosphate guanylyltransferase